MRRRAIVAAMAMVLVGAIAPGPAKAAEPLQPGARVSSDGGGCTLNFVYDGTGAQAGKVYLGTAAHCVTAVGDRVRDQAGVEFGRVAFLGDANVMQDDYAFIEVYSSQVDRVSPALKGHPQYPVGVTSHTETTSGDPVQLSGHGVPFYVSQPTREERVAVLSFDEADYHAVAGPILWGDSGGPLVHIPTGKALGIVSRLCTTACTEHGPSVEGLLARAAAAGFTVSLRSV